MRSLIGHSVELVATFSAVVFCACAASGGVTPSRESDAGVDIVPVDLGPPPFDGPAELTLDGLVTTDATDAILGERGDVIQPDTLNDLAVPRDQAGGELVDVDASRMDVSTPADVGPGETGTVDVRSDTGCLDVCALLHATARCLVGTCQLDRCDPGWGDCNGREDDGCETDVLSSTSHCAICGLFCPGGCSGGRCNIGCCDTAGFGDCDHDCSNGCETNIRTNPMHCGRCGHVCPPETPWCSVGVCRDPRDL